MHVYQNTYFQIFANNKAQKEEVDFMLGQSLVVGSQSRGPPRLGAWLRWLSAHPASLRH
jgi:hypothetical protein